MNEKIKWLEESIAGASHVLVGIGDDWNVEGKPDDMAWDYVKNLLHGKDYFIVYMRTDGKIRRIGFDDSRIVEPCGTVDKLQCIYACHKRVYKLAEIQEKKCPVCGKELTENICTLSNYLEEGYLNDWTEYTRWLERTLNKELLALELGVGLMYPTVIRWPFEKVVYYNLKASLFRIHEQFSQLPEEIHQRSVSIAANPVSLFTEAYQ